MQPNLFVLDCGSIPENATGPLRKFAPDLILLIDAAEMGESAGEIRWVDLDSIGGFSGSSHTLPLPVLAKYLKHEIGCRVELLGIQPLTLEYAQGVSVPVKNAMREVLKEFRILLTAFYPDFL